MSAIFVRVVNMTITASGVIAVVLAGRLLLKSAPKIFSYVLWAAVLFRLLCPVSLPVPVSLRSLLDVPTAPAQRNASQAAYFDPEPVRETVPVDLLDTQTSVQPRKTEAPEPGVPVMEILSWVWFTGAAGMILYGAFSETRFRRHLIGAVRQSGNLFRVDHIGSAFVSGVFFPKIYLPSDLPEDQTSYILAHERHHIRRLDPMTRHLSYLALCIHWFNPLVWLSFILSGKDMETSCDEAVVRKLGVEIRAGYCQALLTLATGRRIIAGSPVAFGEGDTKSRILNLAAWKRAKKRTIVLAAVLSALILTACAANPTKEIVTSKNNGVFDDNAARSAGEMPSPEETVAVSYEDSFQSTDGSVNFRLSIQENLPAGGMPIVEVTPHFLTGADAKRAAEALFDGGEFWEAQPHFDVVYSKSEIQEKLQRWSAYSGSEAIEKLFGMPKEGAVSTVQSYIERYTELLETAPASVPREPCRWRFQEDWRYSFSEESAKAEGLDQGDDYEIAATVTRNGIPYRFSASTRHQPDYSFNSLSVQLDYGYSPCDIDIKLFWNERCRGEKPTEAQLSYARETAQTCLDRMALGNWQVDQCRAIQREEQPEYYIQVTAVPVFEGRAALRRPLMNGIRNPGQYASHYQMSDVEFWFTPDGELIWFVMLSPIDETRVVNENPAVLAMDTLIEKAKDQFRLRDARSMSGQLVESPEVTVEVNQMEYGLTRQKIPNTDEMYYYVPSVLFRGNRGIADGSTGETWLWNENIPLLLLNAVDGTVIPLDNPQDS